MKGYTHPESQEKVQNKEIRKAGEWKRRST